MRKEPERARIATALAALFLTAALFQPGAARAHDGGGGGHGGGGFHGGGFHGGPGEFHAGGFHGGPGGFHGGFAGFPHGGFHDGGFTLADFAASGSTTMASTAASSWPRSSVGCGWARGWAGLITLILTKATTATDLTHNTGIARTRQDITPTYSSATTVGRWFRPTDVGTCRSCSGRLAP